MANSPVPMFVQKIQDWALQLTNATGTAITALAAAGSNGSKIEAINVSSTDTSARDLALYLNDGTTNHLLTTISIPATAGSVDNIASVSLFSSTQWSSSLPKDSNGNPYLYVKAGYTLEVAAPVAVTAAKTIDIIATGADF